MTKPSRRKNEDKVRIIGRWQSIPVAMVRDKALHPQERMLCVLLYTFAGNDGTCYPLQRSLGELMDTTDRTVQRWIKTLVKKHYLTITRTIYGNLYTLHEPESALTNTTPGSDPNPTPGSPQATPGSDPNTTPESDASMTKNQPDLESPTTPPPTPEGDDGDNADSDQGKQTRTGLMLQGLGIYAWKELQEKLKDVPHAEVEERVYKLIDQGKSQAIIVTSLRNIPFTPGTMTDTGALPMDKEYWAKHGFTMGGDVPDLREEMLEWSDREFSAWVETGKLPEQD
jgi:hypothetical protein